jgi:hypothetical protein
MEHSVFLKRISSKFDLKKLGDEGEKLKAEFLSKCVYQVRACAAIREMSRREGFRAGLPKRAHLNHIVCAVFIGGPIRQRHRLRNAQLCSVRERKSGVLLRCEQQGVLLGYPALSVRAGRKGNECKNENEDGKNQRNSPA